MISKTSDQIMLHLSSQKSDLLHKMLFSSHKYYGFINLAYLSILCFCNYVLLGGPWTFSKILFYFLAKLGATLLTLLFSVYFHLDGIRKTFRHQKVHTIRFHPEGIDIAWQGFQNELTYIPGPEIHRLILKSWKVEWKSQYTHFTYYNLYLQIYNEGEKKPLQIFLFSSTNTTALAVQAKQWQLKSRIFYPMISIIIPEWIDSEYGQMSTNVIKMLT